MTIKHREEDQKNLNIEIQLLFEAIHLKYGYDFSNYSMSHLKRRVLGMLGRSNLSSVSAMQHEILEDPDLFHNLLLELSLNVTEMFRDPEFFAAIRKKVVPILKKWPDLKIWHAGCSTGEEVYSMAIVLYEEGLLERSIIYATDFNQIALSKAAEAIYPIDRIREYTENYNKALGKGSFSDYFTVKYSSAKLDRKLKQNIVFADHNLVTDGVFGEMNMILCRNVLIYFNRKLQNRVQMLFFDSLSAEGILCLGSKESLLLTELQKEYTQLDKLNIYKKSATKAAIKKGV